MENKFSAKAKSRAGIFGQVPEAVHDISSQWGGQEPSTLQVGQSVTLDNTGQIEALSTALEGLGALLGSALAAFVQQGGAQALPDPIE